MNFFILIIGLGIGSAIPVYTIKYQKKGLFRNLSLFVLPTFLLFTILIYIISNPIATLYNSPLLGDLLKIGCLFLFGTRFFLFIVGIFLSKEKFNLLSFIMLISQIFGFLLTIILLINNFSVFSIYIGLIATVFLEIILSLIFGNRILREKSETSKVEDIKSISKIALPSYGQESSQYVYDSLIIFLIGFFFSKSETAIYYYANNLNVAILFFTTIIISIGIPAFARLQKDRQEFYIAKLFKFISIIFVPLIFFIIAGSTYITSILYGPAYLNSGYILNFIIFFALFRYFNTLFYVYYLNRKNRILMVVYRVISLAVFIISFYLSISLYYDISITMLSVIGGEACLTFLYCITFLKETNRITKIFKYRSLYSFIVLSIFYIGIIILFKYFIVLTLVEILIITGILLVLYPIFVSLLKILDGIEIDLLEKLIRSLKYFSRPLLFLLSLIKKLSIRH